MDETYEQYVRKRIIEIVKLEKTDKLMLIYASVMAIITHQPKTGQSKQKQDSVDYH